MSTMVARVQQKGTCFARGLYRLQRNMEVYTGFGGSCLNPKPSGLEVRRFPSQGADVDVRATYGLALGIMEKKNGIYYSTLGFYRDNEK